MASSMLRPLSMGLGGDWIDAPLPRSDDALRGNLVCAEPPKSRLGQWHLQAIICKERLSAR